MAAERLWQVELLADAEAGLAEILLEYSDDGFDRALREILALGEDPTPREVRRFVNRQSMRERVSISVTSTRSSGRAAHCGVRLPYAILNRGGENACPPVQRLRVRGLTYL